MNCAGIFGHPDRHKSTGTVFTTAKTKEYKGPGAAVACACCDSNEVMRSFHSMK